MNKEMVELHHATLLDQIRSEAQESLIESVAEWRQEDYHGNFQYLYVTRDDGSFTWEKWLWSGERTRCESAPDFLDRLRKAGLSQIQLYKVIYEFAVCVKRAKSFQELK